MKLVPVVVLSLLSWIHFAVSAAETNLKLASFNELEDANRGPRTYLRSNPQVSQTQINNVLKMYPSEQKVYEAALRQPILIQGSDFASDLSLDLDPPLQANVDYTLDVTSSTTAMLKLMPGKKWPTELGFVIVKRLLNAGVRQVLEENGVIIATVLADPVVLPSGRTVFDSQSKPLKLIGTGFTSTSDVKVALYPTQAGTYKVCKTLPHNVLFVCRESGASWLPDHASVRGHPDKKVLYVEGVDTGAGMIHLTQPVPVAYVNIDAQSADMDDDSNEGDDDA